VKGFGALNNIQVEHEIAEIGRPRAREADREL
jgi:hypothetical protein